VGTNNNLGAVGATQGTVVTESVPPVGEGTPGATGVVTESGLPLLATPLNSNLPLEQLVKALGLEGRNIELKNGREAIESKGKERQEEIAKEIEQIQKQLEAMAKQKKLSPFMKAFKWIGMIVSAIAAVATIAAGVLTANPLLVAGGVILAVMAVNSIVSEATDGKYSISAGVAEIAKKCGASDETAQWIGMGVEIGIMIVGTVMTLGAGSGSIAAGAASKAINIASKVITVISAGVSVAQGGLTIANSVYQYDADMAKALQKEIQAILERIQEALETETKFLEVVMERAQKLNEQVGELIKINNEAQTAVTTGQTTQAPVAA
jgi:hypothetical protein